MSEEEFRVDSTGSDFPKTLLLSSAIYRACHRIKVDIESNETCIVDIECVPPVLIDHLSDEAVTTVGIVLTHLERQKVFFTKELEWNIHLKPIVEEVLCVNNWVKGE